MANKVPLIRDGVPTVDAPATDDQLLLDMAEVRERIRALHKALLEQEAAGEKVREAQTCLTRAKLEKAGADRKVFLLSAAERRIARRE